MNIDMCGLKLSSPHTPSNHVIIISLEEEWGVGVVPI